MIFREDISMSLEKDVFFVPNNLLQMKTAVKF